MKFIGILEDPLSDTSLSDITGFSLQSDSGSSNGYYATSGEVFFKILGGDGVEVTNSGSVFTATAVAGEINHDSLLGFVDNEHLDWTVNWAGGNIHSGNIPTLNQNTTGTAATVTGAAQASITSLGTLTYLQVDDITLNAKAISILGDTNDWFSITTGAAGATTLSTTDAEGHAGDITLAADGNVLLEFDGTTGDGVKFGLKGQAHSLASFQSHHYASWFYIYENGGASGDDYFAIETEANGSTTIHTQDAAGTDAHLAFNIDGKFSVASASIDISTGGIITNAAWSGDVIASAYLDSDTAHLSGTQTFTGVKTFNEIHAATNLTITNTAASGSGNGGVLKLRCNDGAAMGNNHRIGTIDFWGAEDASSTYKAGASISAYADAAWSASENGTRLEFRTTDANADGPDVALTLDSDQNAEFVGDVAVAGNLDLSGNLKKALHYVHADIKDTGSDMTDEYYLSLGDAEREATNPLNVALPIILPASGVLKKVIKRSQSDFSSKAWSYKVKRVPSGTALGSNILMATVTKNAGGATNTNSIIDFTTDASNAANACTFETGYSTTEQFNAGDMILFSYQCTSASGPNGTPKVVWTLVFEIDETTI